MKLATVCIHELFIRWIRPQGVASLYCLRCGFFVCFIWERASVDMFSSAANGHGGVQVVLLAPYFGTLKVHFLLHWNTNFDDPVHFNAILFYTCFYLNKNIEAPPCRVQGRSGGGENMLFQDSPSALTLSVPLWE